MSLVSTLILVVVSITVALGIASVFNLVGRQQRDSNREFQLLRIRTTVLQTFNDPKAWNHTFSSADNFECIKSSKTCDQNPQKLILFDSQGSAFYDSGNPQFGFDENGKPCRQFKDSLASSCPFRVVFRVERLSENIKNPVFRIIAEFKISESVQASAIDFRKLQFEVIKNMMFSKRNCLEYYQAGHTQSGPYLIDPDDGGGIDPFQVYCDMMSPGGPWTLAVSEVQPGTIIPEDPPLSLSARGQLTLTQMDVILSNTTAPSSQNNVKVEFELPQITIAARISPPVKAWQIHTTANQSAACGFQTDLYKEAPVTSATTHYHLTRRNRDYSGASYDEQVLHFSTDPSWATQYGNFYFYTNIGAGGSVVACTCGECKDANSLHLKGKFWIK